MSFNKRNTIGQSITAWFKKNQRPLPWRKDYESYSVWISEIMLQQTQVIKVIPFFERWMENLPTVENVAQAKEDELLLLWEGLGYYSRVINIHKAAKIIMAEHGGTIPETEKALKKLPGIGPYTASAILSLAFNKDVPVLDGNDTQPGLQ
jgi:A/G-specific adenine glycosylase